MSCTTVIERKTTVVITRPECGQRVIVRPVTSRTVVTSQPTHRTSVAVRGVRGLPGFDVELQKSATHVQWRLHKDGEAWQNLIAIADLVGPPSMADAPTDGTPYARKDGAWAAAATAAQGAKADAAIPAAQKGAVNGVATLDAGGKIPESQIPAVVITDVFTVASQSAMLALTAERGDIAVRSDLNKSFALAAEPASTLANWIELRTPPNAVLSVAGKTGAVTLTAADVGAQAPLVSGGNIKTVGGQSLLGIGNVPLGDFLYGALDPDNGGGADGDVYTQSDGKLWKKAAGAWTYTGIQFAAQTAAVLLAGAQTVAGVKTFSNRSVHAGAYTPSLTPAHSATPTFDCATGNVFEPATMTGNVTSITLTNATAGQTVQIRFQQDATGGRTCAVPSGAKVDGSINTGANRVSWLIMTYSYLGSRWEGNFLHVPA